MKRFLVLMVVLVGFGAWGAVTTFPAVENMARSTLTAELTGSAVAIAVADGSVFPAAGAFYVVVFTNPSAGYEVVLCDSVAGNTITVNASGRGAQGTSAATWASGAYVQQSWTAGEVEGIYAAINAIEGGTNELAGVDLPDDGRLLFGDGDDIQMGWDGTYLELLDADDNVFLELADAGGAGTFRLVDSLSVGAEDGTRGTLRALGGATSSGGRLLIDNAADSDSTINQWSLESISGVLKVSMDATPLTTWTDSTGAVAFPYGSVTVGTYDSVRGTLTLYANSSTSSPGIVFDVPPNYDATTNAYRLTTGSGDFQIANQASALTSWDDVTGDVTFETDLVQGVNSRNRMRNLWIPASEFVSLAGTPALSSVSMGTGGRFAEWSMDPASDEDVSALVALSDYDGGAIKVKLVWAASSGNVVWNVICGSIAEGEAAAGSTVNAVTDTAASATLFNFAYLTFTPDVATDLDLLISIIVRRDADNGSDTLATDAYFFGVLIYY